MRLAGRIVPGGSDEDEEAESLPSADASYLEAGDHMSTDEDMIDDNEELA